MPTCRKHDVLRCEMQRCVVKRTLLLLKHARTRGGVESSTPPPNEWENRRAGDGISRFALVSLRPDELCLIALARDGCQKVEDAIRTLYLRDRETQSQRSDREGEWEGQREDA